MKATIPEKTVDVCDFCQRERFLETCWVCGRQACRSHQGIVPATWGFADLCCECAFTAAVQKVCNKYADQLTLIYRAKESALKRLGKKKRRENDA